MDVLVSNGKRRPRLRTLPALLCLACVFCLLGAALPAAAGASRPAAEDTDAAAEQPVAEQTAPEPLVPGEKTEVVVGWPPAPPAPLSAPPLGGPVGLLPAPLLPPRLAPTWGPLAAPPAAWPVPAVVPSTVRPWPAAAPRPSAPGVAAPPAAASAAPPAPVGGNGVAPPAPTSPSAALSTAPVASGASSTLAAAGSSPGGSQGSQAPKNDVSPLHGHVLAALPQASPLAAQPRLPGESLALTIVLSRTDQAGFEAFLRDVQDPQSPNFRRFASQTELAQRFGPSQQAYDSVLAYLQQNGFTLVEGSANRLTLTVRGTREQAERSFNTQILDYQLGGRVFRANAADPAVPTSLAPRIQSVEGLNNLAVPRPLLARAPREAITPHAAPNPTTPMSIATAYNFPSVRNPSGAPATGAGQIIGIVAYDAYFTSDVQNWITSVGLCAAGNTACINGFLGRLVTVQLTGPLTPSGGGGETEVLLDIAVVMGMAQGATYRVYESCNACPSSFGFQAMFNRMLSDGVTVISNSWGSCEPDNTLASVRGIDLVLQAASAAGVASFHASGDTGSTCQGIGVYPNAVDVPADAPNGTAVGGTTLQVGAGNVYQSESYWNSTCSGTACNGGFGVSVYFPVPAYQSGLASGGRSVPDVAADANPATGISLFQADQGGLMCCIGGTSMAAPIWAAGIALVNEALGHLTGNWNTVFYSQRTTSAFHPPSSMGSDFAHVGLGSFNLSGLAGQFPCTVRPNIGVTVVNAGGGRLMATITAQTNASTPTNQLQAVQFTSATSAVVTSSSGAPIAVPSSPTVPAGATTFSFIVAQSNPAQGATVSLTVTDACGIWPTFVGGGPTAF